MFRLVVCTYYIITYRRRYGSVKADRTGPWQARMLLVSQGHFSETTEALLEAAAEEKTKAQTSLRICEKYFNKLHSSFSSDAG